jgi:hypothetical protein
MKPVTTYLQDNPVFAILGLLVAIAALVGGVVTIVNPDTLNFEDYLDDLGKFAVALGVYAVGKGVLHGGASIADAVQDPPLPLDVPPPVSEAQAEAAFQDAGVPAGQSGLSLVDDEGEQPPPQTP